jgi:hypothetical protein
LKVPLAFRSLYGRRGGIVVAGVTLIALALSAIALGVIGLAATFFLILLIAFAELWREVTRYEEQVPKLESNVTAGSIAVDQAHDLESRVRELQEKNAELVRQANSPSSSYEGLLATITAHLQLLSLVEKHRAMRDDAPDAPVTQAESLEGDEVRITANCAGSPETLLGESIVIIDTQTGFQVSGVTSVIDANNFEIFAQFNEDSLPSKLTGNLRQLDKVIPDGYALRLAGLISEFEAISDDALRDLAAALDAARKRIHAVVSESGGDEEGKNDDLDVKELEIE